MKYLSMKILVALGIISATSMQGVYATANAESDTSLDKMTYSIKKSKSLGDEEKESLITMVEDFENLPQQDQIELLQELEDNGIKVPDTLAQQPTFISNNR